MKLKEIHYRWLGILALTYILAVFFKNGEAADESFLLVLSHSFAFCAVLWNGCGFLLDYFNRRLSTVKDTPKRLIMSVLSLTAWLIVGSNLISVALGNCTLQSMFETEYFFRNNDVSLIAGFTVSAFYVGSDFFSKWKDSERLNEELKNQQIRTQFGVLQNQMSPHFLFNSLNTLTTLIAEDQKTAIDFTQTLSEVYRYILQNKERELVSLHEEITFCESYVYLLKKRYPENLHVKCQVDKNYHEKFIAPLTLQMLVENAIKHNVVSKSMPLVIEIYIDELGEIVVKNNLQIKKSLEKSTKTGLENIRKRYELLGNREVKVITSREYFRVAIPLIEVQAETDYLKSKQA